MNNTSPKTYCDYVAALQNDDVHRAYHDTQYGFPIDSDNELFGRLILEINQAGLNWTMILNRQATFRQAYFDFDIQRIAQFTDEDVARLLSDPGVIRNRLKIQAAISNAQTVLHLQQEYGSFKDWLLAHHPQPLETWVKLFKKTFKFTGFEITKEFLVSTGYLEGAHRKECPIHEAVLSERPAWMS